MKTLTFAVLLAVLAIVMLGSCEDSSMETTDGLVPPTVDQDPSLPSIFVNGTQLHSETFGLSSDPMIVVIHGGPGSDYRGMLKCSTFAADGYYAVFYDQRGSGLSRRHPKEDFTDGIFVDDLDAVISYYRQPGQKVILMGLSWGAMLATSYVNTYPDTVDGLVLMEPGGLTWDDTKKYISRWMSLDFFDETSNDHVYLDQIITSDQHVLLDYKAALRSAGEFAPGNKLGIAGPSPFWRFGAVCNQTAIENAEEHPFDFTTNLRNYTRPVLFAYSELNQAYGRSHAELVSSAFPDVRLVEIKGTGHEITYFGWDGFYPVATEYLNTIR